jgi:hypothetical protein
MAPILLAYHDDRVMTIGEAMAILALEGTPTLEEIQAARRLQLKVWHPDRFADDAVVQAEAERRTKLINQAWRTLEAEYELRGALPRAKRSDERPEDEDGADEREAARRVRGWSKAPFPHSSPDEHSHKRWSEGVVTAILCAGWLIPIIAGAVGIISESAALGGFMIFVLVAYAYLVLTRFVK